MRISYNWLKDYIDIKLPAGKLAELLTMAGLAVDSVEKKANDHILELEVTANRPDWLSYIGIARELSALTGGKLKIPSSVSRISYSEKKRTTDNGQRMTVRVEDKALCPRYTARVITGVKVQESPAWLKARLESVGLRPVNNVVDITNFCLLETGEPMHAFDLDKLEGNIVVRRARKLEKIVTIDGSGRALDESVLVIADNERPVAIAGVMGGLDTEVTGSTKNILLEAAYFDPISVRRASRKFGISTESSYRFERKVDMANIARASDRASRLISEIAGGKIRRFTDIGARPQPKKEVSLEYEKIGSILGVRIPAAKVKKILNSLGLKTKASSRDKIRMETPAFRYDLNDEIDLIEEIARIYGYDSIPATIPQILEQPARLPYETVVSQKIREILSSLGCDEIITYSLIGKRSLAGAASGEEGVVEVRNPLTSEQEMMRPDLRAGMYGAMLWNMNRRTKDLKLFELGNIYIKEEGDKFVERKHLSIATAGGAFSIWAGGARQAGLFDLKGIVETLFAELGVKDLSFSRARRDGFSPAACASITVGGSTVGVISQVSPEVLNNFDIKEKVCYCEICVGALLEHIRLEKRFVELPKYPSVSRDISMVVGKEALHSELVSAVREAAGPILKDVQLTDRYVGKQIPDDKIGLTYRIEYQDIKKTLEDKEVSEVHVRIIQSLEKKFGAKLR